MSKKIELRQVSLKSDQEANYKEWFTLALDTMPEGGFTMKDFRERSRIEEALNSNAGGVFVLEDYDVTILKRLVNNIKWAIRDPAISEFLEYIDKL